ISPFDVEVELASGDIDCAWGGLSVPGGSTDQMTVTAPYLTDNQVVVVKASSGIKRLSQLKGKLIAIRDNVNLINIFENSAALSDLNLNKRYLPGLGDCFEALEQGSSDAVLVSEFAAKYVMAGNALETTPPSPPEAPTPSPSPDSSAPESP
ncbi:MAG: transporter substrate-binding domain-containing protein, partial [Firmicutes bacterium]|nr:transporter substrate-binding domain-containing protein [Bacillota bacterium]